MENDFKKLIDLLEPDYNPDFWNDEIISDAGMLLDRLQEEEWTRLLGTWKRKPTGWCVRLVEASLLSEKSRVIGLLVSMLKRPEAEVGAAAAAMLLEKNYQWSPEESLLPDLKRHLEHASDLQAGPLRRLLSRLPA